MGDFDHKQVKDKMGQIRNGKNAFGNMLLTRFCQTFVKLFGDGPLVTLSGEGNCFCSQSTKSST